MTDFFIKKGDVLPILRVQLQDSSSNNVNISGCLINFNYKLRPTGNIIFRTGSVYDGENGVAQYSWVSGDTSNGGFYEGEFLVTFPDMSQMTFPPGHNLVFCVVDDIS